MWTQHQTAEGSGLTWTCVSEPTHDEKERLIRQMGVERGFVEHSLDVDEAARMEKSAEDMLVVLRVPRRMPHGARLPTTTVALGVILLPDKVVGVCAHALDIGPALLERFKQLESHTHHRVLLSIILVVAERFVQEVRFINSEVDKLEERLRESQGNQEVVALLRYQKALVHLINGLQTNALLLDRFERDSDIKVAPSDHNLVEDARIELRQAIEMTTIAENILGQMMDAFASIIGNNLNSVMKFLTSFTILIMVPGLVAGIYGMNVDLPFQKDPHAFALVMLSSVALSGLVAWVLWNRKML